MLDLPGSIMSLNLSTVKNVPIFFRPLSVKQIKKWRRDKKLALIESINPDWKDLSLEDFS